MEEEKEDQCRKRTKIRKIMFVKVERRKGMKVRKKEEEFWKRKRRRMILRYGRRNGKIWVNVRKNKTWKKELKKRGLKIGNYIRKK